ncbi:MAG TPA: hypothetical protein VFK23_11660, partial [Nitrospirota bacterium]|nr:hypothetical protein [Nitrospirota bacterium]
VYPWIEPFYTTGDMDQVTLPELTGMNHWVVVAVLYVLAGVMFYLMEWYERRRARPFAGNATGRTILTSRSAASHGSL